MRQVLIEKNELINEISGSKIKFEVNDIEILPFSIDKHGVMVRFPFSVKSLSGGKLDLDFSLPKDLVSKGVCLMGAYWENNEITAYLTSTLDKVEVEKNDVFLIATLIEVVYFRQISKEVSEIRE
jgi:hypothetical protein